MIFVVDTTTHRVLSFATHFVPDWHVYDLPSAMTVDNSTEFRSWNANDRSLLENVYIDHTLLDSVIVNRSQ